LKGWFLFIVIVIAIIIIIINNIQGLQLTIEFHLALLQLLTIGFKLVVALGTRFSHINLTTRSIGFSQEDVRMFDAAAVGAHNDSRHDGIAIILVIITIVVVVVAVAVAVVVVVVVAAVAVVVIVVRQSHIDGLYASPRRLDYSAVRL
jgi:hypothetical protein